MSLLMRWGKFNLVGAIGVAVQLSVLAVLNRCAPGHYILASAAALEVTLLHNFVWHHFYTWRERNNQGTIHARLFRFHLSNGVVSMVGNLVLMRLLVQDAHVPVLASNGIAILICSLVNFWLGEHWAFSVKNADVRLKANA